MLAAQQGHRPGRQHRHRSRERTKLDPSCQPVAEAGQVLPQGVDTGQYPPRMFHHDGARRGHACAARLTDEQRMPGCRLDGPDLPRDGRRLTSARADTPGGTVQPFGPAPSGYLIFTDSGYFTDVLHRPDLPAFTSGDRLAGTGEENAHTVQDTLVVFGTYTVDDAGVFKDEQVLRSSFPNWNGMRRDTSSLTETVQEDTMTEHLDDGNGVVITLTFSRQN